MGNVSAKVQSFLPKYEQIQLENGLQVVVVPMRNGSGVIETDVFYKVGSRNETMGKSGIAHMLEHMNFKSSKNLKSGEFDEIVKKFGGLTNASTGFDYTRYFIKSSTENLDKSLGLFAELMGNLSLKEDEFLPERNVVAEERRWRTDNSPMGYLYFRFFNTAFVYHPYHWTPIGFMEDIQNWDIEDIRKFHSIYYQPNNAIVLVAGDVDPKVVFDSAKKHFSNIKNKVAKIPEVYMQEPKQDGSREGIVHKDTEVQWIALGYKIPNFQSKDQVALSAIADLFSGGKSALLQSELVDKKHLVSQAYAYNMDLKDKGIFLFIAGANKGVDIQDVKKEILSLIDRIKKGKITQEELDKIKINTKASFIYSLEDSSSVAELFGSYLARGDIQPLLEYEEKFDALKIEDIVEVAKKYFVPSSQTTLILKK
ncbi:M16 family metallopeptidase [Helicobacter cappadocius]|uniref:Pitrilysin family protein n=1 Tax=Helicobacter cappadocius TaxID=3063998 RepID=A0AA90PW37_9HELI|nr:MULTISPECIES: pitrilysin family protein [unclassified Helicobacter]MDO7253371.1 pitrilysin family protein [Helicobacter sp. faydin-H75]MDP2539365.1 pitrilysin family protein [Helicobacter sp. faydin-H76]